MIRVFRVLCACLLGLVAFQPATGGQTAPRREPGSRLKALIIDGQNNHNWRATTPVLKAALEESGRFAVDVVTSPQDKDWAKFRPKFSQYDVVVSNYNGELWPEPVRKDFEDYVGGGGGFVSVHAADNSFPQWPEYNKMIGVGGWATVTKSTGQCCGGVTAGSSGITLPGPGERTAPTTSSRSRHGTRVTRS